jgi:hypothetical protein
LLHPLSICLSPSLSRHAECAEDDDINNADALDGSCSDEDDGPEITAMNGLSLDVLQMLQRFQNDGCFLEDEEEDTTIPRGGRVRDLYGS